MIQYMSNQENKEEMVCLAVPTITKEGGIRKSGTANKTQPTMNRERFEALLENGTNNSGELMDTIEAMFQPERQVRSVQLNPLMPINDNRQISLICTTKTRNVQELVVPKIPKTGDLIRGSRIGRPVFVQCS